MTPNICLVEYHRKFNEMCIYPLPTEIHVEITENRNYTMLTCNSSCLSDPQTAYRWYWNKELINCESQDLISYSCCSNAVSCGLKAHEDLLSDEVCEYEPAFCLL